MKVCVVGAGSIGGIIASRLDPFADVTAILRGKNFQAVKNNGYKIFDCEGKVLRSNVKAENNIKSLDKQDLIVLSVKAHQITDLVFDIKHIMHKSTIVLTMQNGIPWWYFKKLQHPLSTGHIESVDPNGFIFSNIDSDKIIGSVVYMAAEKIQPGVIKSMEKEKISLGELDGSSSDRLKKICKLFVKAGIKAPLKTDIRSEIWIKLMGNCTLNPISAVTHNTLLEICKSPHGKDIVYKMCNEVKKIGESYGANFRISIADRIKAAENVGHHKTSMLQDIECGREIELGALLGSVLELGEVAKIKTPYLESIFRCCSMLNLKLKGSVGGLRISN